jgi:hypothetical protein
MVDKGNVDKHRYSREGVGKVVEEQKWGRAKAEERYGTLKYRDGAPRPEDRHAPQKLGDRNNLQGPNYQNIHPSNSWVRGGGAKQAEGKPNFHPGIRRPGKV